MAEKIASRLLQARGERTQEEVARAVGVSRASICQYEQGIRVPSDTVKLALAHYYGKTVQELFFDI